VAFWGKFLPIQAGLSLACECGISRRSSFALEKIMRYLLALAACSLFTTASLNAQEHKIQRSALPAAVEKSLLANLQGATIKGFATEVEGGRKVYEAETVLNGHTRDLQFAVDGSLNEIEEEASFDSLPAPVQQALKVKAGLARITKVESLTKHAKLVAYEAAIMKGTKKGEVQVGPNGATLKHEE
jgi:hypothetical protein